MQAISIDDEGIDNEKLTFDDTRPDHLIQAHSHPHFIHELYLGSMGFSPPYSFLIFHVQFQWTQKGLSLGNSLTEPYIPVFRSRRTHIPPPLP